MFLVPALCTEYLDYSIQTTDEAKYFKKRNMPSLTFYLFLQTVNVWLGVSLQHDEDI